MRRPQRDVCRIFIAKNNQKLKLKKHADNSTRTYSYLKQKAKLKTAHTQNIIKIEFNDFIIYGNNF